MLIIALIATLGTFVVFCTTTLVNEPATATALVVILALAADYRFAVEALPKPLQISTPAS